jgi:predicted aspartyl protease
MPVRSQTRRGLQPATEQEACEFTEVGAEITRSHNRSCSLCRGVSLDGLSNRVRAILKRIALLAVLLAVSIARAAEQSCPTTISFVSGAMSVSLPGIMARGRQIFATARINGNSEDLRFAFDTGCGRTVLDRSVASRLGLRASGKSSIGGVGTGRLNVDVVKNASLQLGDVRIDGVDLNLVDDTHEEKDIAGIIGYDLLCGSVVTLDYKQPAIVVSAPSMFQYHGNGDVLPLSFKGRWSYVRGTLKVPGVDAVTDNFLIDTGSEDAVNHPVIRQSKGELRQTNTGAGGFGESQPGVIGPNEWFRIGNTTLPATQSVCCAGNEDVNRQLGSQVLSHFRIIFNYPARSVIFEKYSE